MNQPQLATITVSRLRLRACHGVLPQERVVGGDFEVSVTLTVDASEAIASDRLEGTVNYAEVVDIVKRQMAVPSRLIEHVAGRIRTALLAEYPHIAGGSVTVAKLTPPIAARIMGGVSVTLPF